MFNFIERIIKAELGYLKADWWILLLGIMIAVGVKVYVDSERLRDWMNKKSGKSIFGTIGFGAFTPLCACGTMAVILSMFVSSLPWGPVMAFLVSSPLTSPSQFFLQSGILGIEFSIAILICSLAMGLGAGFLASYLEKNTAFFSKQYRLLNEVNSCCEGKEREAVKENSCCNIDNVQKENWLRRWKIDQVFREFYELGIKKVLFYFMIFIALGQIVEMAIPTEWILQLFSPEKVYSIPLAALIGLPIYVSGVSSLPLLETFLNAGAGGGAALAFLIAGQGTSVAVIAGISTFLKKKAVLFYIVFVLFGGIISGYIFQWLI